MDPKQFHRRLESLLDRASGPGGVKAFAERLMPPLLEEFAPLGFSYVKLYRLREGNWDELKESFADRCFDVLEEYAPNWRRAVIDRQVLSPLDFEREFGLTGGNIFQGAMTLGQLFFLRPLPGFAQYRTPIRGLYMCGAATHPGGGVMGACGHNAAREILRDGPRVDI